MTDFRNINTPMGKIRTGHGTTRSSGATGSIENIKESFTRVINNDVLKPEDLLEEERENAPEKNNSK